MFLLRIAWYNCRSLFSGRITDCFFFGGFSLGFCLWLEPDPASLVCSIVALLSLPSAIFIVYYGKAVTVKHGAPAWSTIALHGLNSSQRGHVNCFTRVHRLVHMAVWVCWAVNAGRRLKNSDNEKLLISNFYAFSPFYIGVKAMFYVCTQLVSNTLDLYCVFIIFIFHGLAVRGICSGVQRWGPCVPPVNHQVHQSEP